MTNILQGEVTYTETELQTLRSRPQSVRRMKQVVVIQTSLTHYRIPFFQGLRETLLRQGINLRLLYGRSGRIEQSNSVLPWAETFQRLPRIGKLVCHPVIRPLFDADLIIVEDATKHVTNYLAFLIKQFGNCRFALWGHGKNRQAERTDTFREHIKGWIGKRCDWYFAYTAAVKNELIARGYDGRRITNVQNAIAGPTELPDKSANEALRQSLSIPSDSVVANYCGRMYPIKQIGLLIEAAELVSKRLPTFRLVLGGSGVDQSIAANAARRHKFVDYLGPIFGSSKSALFGISHLTVMPGALGLGILDSFHYGLPPVVVRNRSHGPEIEYLQENVNGLLVNATAEGLAEGICKLANDAQLYSRLKQGCMASANQLTIANMVERFAGGVTDALEF